MANETVTVNAESKDGKKIFEGNIKIPWHGFFELWLPRNTDVKLTLKANGKKSEGMVYTYDDSKTCLTTFRLE